MTFHTFTTADTLFNMLIQRYRMETPDDLTIAEFQEWRTHAIAIQRSVFTIFTMWLEDHRLLEEEPHIAQRMIAFLRLIVMPPLSAMAQNLMQTIERLVRSLVSLTCPWLLTLCRPLPLLAMHLLKLHVDVENHTLTRMTCLNSIPLMSQNN